MTMNILHICQLNAICVCVCMYIDIGIIDVVYITVCLPFFSLLISILFDQHDAQVNKYGIGFSSTQWQQQ